MSANDHNIVKRTSQYIDNLSFDEATELAMVEIAGTDGVSVNKLKVQSDGSFATNSPQFALKLQTSGTDTYVGEADPGTAQSSAVWRCQKVDGSGNITWADGNASFDNIATDLTALTYS